MKEIKTLERRLNAEIAAPPSKAHTLRALFIAAMADDVSLIKKPLLAEDQYSALKGLNNLGVGMEITKTVKGIDAIAVGGLNGRFRSPPNPINVGGSGFSARILAVLGSLTDKGVVIDGNKRLRKRPLQDLLEAIEPLGIRTNFLDKKGFLTLRVEGESFIGGTTRLRGDKSSQYFSAILMCAPYSKKGVTILTDGEISSKPYIDITIQIMKDFGVKAVNEGYSKFIVESGQQYEGRVYEIEGDFSSASFFFEAAAITQGKARVNNLNHNSMQGDRKFVDFLDMMGCEVNKGNEWIEIIGKPLKAIKVDMKDYPDIVVPLAVTAAFAEGTSEFYNIGHLKYKECDRLEAPATELKKMGINAKDTKDSIIIEGGKPHGAEIDTYKDHRMAMSFAVAGLKVPGIKIKNPKNVNKSFPEFWDVVDKLY